MLQVQGKPCAQPERPACRPPPPCARGVPRACRARAAARDGLCRGSAYNVRLSLVWIWVNLSGARPCAAALPRRAPVLAAHSVLAAMCRELNHAGAAARDRLCRAISKRLWAVAAVCLVCVCAETAGDMRCGTSALAKSLTESRLLSIYSIYQIPFGKGPGECSVSRALWPCSAIFVLWLLLSLRQTSFFSLMLPTS